MLRYLRDCGFDLSTFECWVYNPDKANLTGRDRYDRKVAQVRVVLGLGLGSSGGCTTPTRVRVRVRG